MLKQFFSVFIVIIIIPFYVILKLFKVLKNGRYSSLDSINMFILYTSIFSGKWMSMIIYMTILIWKDLFRLIIFHMYRDENSDTTRRNSFSLFSYINSSLSAKLVSITSYKPFENCISDGTQNATLRWLYSKSFRRSLKSYL